MLIREEPGGGFLAIGQASHAWISGQLARAWGNERFGAVEPWEEVCLGAEQHDVGWAEWDLDPKIDPGTGRPHTFISSPLEVKLDLWSRAARKVISQSRYAALLVSMHGTAIFDRFGPDDPAGKRLVENFIEEQRALQAKLAEGLDPDQVRRNQKLVFAWDYISLALCLDWAPAKVRDVPVAEGEPVTLELSGQGELDPWPFGTESVELRADARRIATGGFEDWQTVPLEFTLRPRR
ncbi:MAG TPA: DUF3891 family protein [Thermoleophilaceae bacterium]|nr:DUF3891 family protein [Thermoleophilaceae bacterium]